MNAAESEARLVEIMLRRWRIDPKLIGRIEAVVMRGKLWLSDVRTCVLVAQNAWCRAGGRGICPARLVERCLLDLILSRL